VGGQVYALPNVHVATSAVVDLGAERMTLDGQEMPVISLHQLLGAEPAADARRLPVVVVEFAGRKLATTCDKVIGAREIVVKSLGPLLAPLGLFAGGTISGSGKVQIILDPAALASLAYPAPGAVRAASQTPEVARSGPITQPGSARATGRARVLVADDSRSLREALSRMLAAEGHIVDAASDGWDAWEMLHEVRYDLLVTDLEMPRLGGEKLVEKVRHSGDFPELKVVVISSRTTAALRERILASGADLFLAKPITHETLAPKVAELLADKVKP
jgi:CheY-like chemotaxis protein